MYDVDRRIPLELARKRGATAPGGEMAPIPGAEMAATGEVPAEFGGVPIGEDGDFMDGERSRSLPWIGR